MFSIMPEHGSIIERAAQALRTGGRFVILDIKEPPRWPTWFFTLMLLFIKPFGASYELYKQKSWVAMEKYFKRVTVSEGYGGAIYIAVGEK
jgi:hypothetical protein